MNETNPLRIWLQAPDFPGDRRKTQSADLLNTALWAAVALLVTVTAGLLISGGAPAGTLAVCTVMLLSALAMLGALRRGHVRLAGVMLTAGGIAANTAAVATLGTIRTPAAAGYIVLVAIAGLLWGARGLAATSVASSAVLLALFAAEHGGLLPAPATETSLSHWLSYCAMILWSGVPVRYALASINRALERAELELAARRQAEAESAAQRDFALAVMDSMGEGLAVVDSAQHFDYVNGTLARMLGRAAGALTGQPLKDVLDPAAHTPWDAAYARCRAGEPARFDATLLPAGEPAFAAAISLVPRLVKGEFAGAIVVAADLRERRRMEQAVEAERDFARAVMGALGEGLAVTDDAMRLEYVNPAFARMLGRAESAVTGRPTTDFITDADRALHRDEHARREAGQSTVYELNFLHADGHVVPARVSAVPRAQDGPYAGAIAVISDLSVRRELEREAAAQRDFALAVMNTMGEGLAVADRDGRLEYINGALARMLGQDADRLAGRLLSETAAPEDSATREAMDALCRGESAGEFEVRLAHSDGRLVPARISAAPRQSGGAPAGVIAVVSDLTERKRVEQVLRDERDFAQTVMNAMNQGLTVTGSDGRYEYVNPAFAQLMGRAPADLIGKRPDDVVAPEDAGVLARARGAMRQGKAATYEVRNLRRDGARLPVQVSAVPRPSGGAFAGTIAVVTDLSERTRMEDALRASEARYRELFTESQAVMMLLDPQTNTIVDANAAASRFYGYTLDRLRGMHINQIDTNPIAAARPALALALAEGQQRFTFEHRLASGERRTVEAFVTVLHGESSPLIHAIVHDVTERKRLERELEKQYHLVTSVLDTMGQGLAVTDADGRIEYVNPALARMLGHPPDRIIGHRTTEAMAPVDPAERARVIQQRRAGAVGSYAAMLQCADGSRLDVLITGVPRWNDQTYAGTVAVITDISGQSHLQQELRAQRDFTRSVMDAIDQGLIVTDTDGRVEHVNEALARLLGREHAALIGQPARDIVAAASREASAQQAARAQAGERTRAELQLVHRDGRRVPVMLSAAPRTAGGAYAGMIGAVTDLTEQKSAEARLVYISTHDALTDVYNRAFLESFVERLEDGREFPVSVVAADLDNLRAINERRGQAAGDALLQRAAHILEAAVGRLDILARTGSGEFVLVMPGTDAQTARQVLATIRDVEGANNRATAGEAVRLSLACATTARGGLPEALAQAGRALAAEKRARRGSGR